MCDGRGCCHLRTALPPTVLLSNHFPLASAAAAAAAGTITHMPPELLEHGVSSKAADVYSFGVLLWQVRLIVLFVLSSCCTVCSEVLVGVGIG
jgi:serine/threonine protein kinase